MVLLSEGKTDGRNRAEWNSRDVLLPVMRRATYTRTRRRRGNSFADKFRRPKHRSQCSILLIGVFVGGIQFNSRMRWVDISPEVSCADRNGWRLYPYPYPERRGRAKNLPTLVRLRFRSWFLLCLSPLFFPRLALWLLPTIVPLSLDLSTSLGSRRSLHQHPRRCYALDSIHGYASF